MTLSRQDRRALRDIEEHLAAEDPGLAGLLRRATRRERRIRGVTRWVVWVAVTLLVLGLVLATMSLVVGGVLMLTFLPAAWLLVAILDRRR
jgi:cell division septal protein FtsQ